MVLYYTKGLCRLLSGVCHINGRWRKGKGIELPSEYNYYCGPTKDPAFIFATVLFPLVTKQDRAFMQDGS